MQTSSLGVCQVKGRNGVSFVIVSPGWLRALIPWRVDCSLTIGVITMGCSDGPIFVTAGPSITGLHPLYPLNPVKDGT